jgi:LysR family hydrogen peroxide-inducible transcriptional activator
MNLRDLEYFAAVAELGGFGAAAKQCFVSQPTLSGQLRKLEEELGQPLFERSTRRVRLTDFGKEALEPVKSALEAVEKLRRMAEEHRDPFSGPVTVGAFPTLAPWLLSRISRPLHEQYPKSEFYLTEDKSPNLSSALTSGGLDVAFLALPVDIAGVEVVPLFSESFYLAVPGNHPWRDRKTVRAEELARQELLLLEDGHCLRDQALDLCHRFGAREKGYFRAAGLETLRQMIRMNMGMTLIPRMAIPGEEEPGIRYLALRDEDAHRNIGLCFRATHPRRALFLHMADTIRGLAGTVLPVTPLSSQ